MEEQQTQTTKHPSLLTGGIVGLLLTLPLLAVLYLGDQLLGLPFLPFDNFDFIARVLPGAVITFGIDIMVSIITGLQLGELSSAAKTAEQLMALGAFLAVGVLFGLIYFVAMRRAKDFQLDNYAYGIIPGFLVGAVLMAISTTVNVTATANVYVSIIWVLLIFSAWGAAFAWVYHDLSSLPETGDKAKTGDAQAINAEAAGLNRRQFLVRVGGATATLTVVGAGLSSVLREDTPSVTPGTDSVQLADGSPLPNADDPLVPAPGTRPEYTPLEDHYRIDISARPPVIDSAAWVLPITGLVENPVELTLDDIRSEQFSHVDRYVTMSCISNRLGGDLISTTKWTGIPMKELVDMVKPTAEAQAIRITSADGFDEYVLLDLIENEDRIMLAYAWDDQPLLQKHGFPLRIHIPDLYGMKQPKWITGMEFVEREGEGYWVRRGWDAVARVNATSVIDTVSIDGIEARDGDFFVPVGGIAWSGARGISKVEVRVDDGEWQEAQLRSPISDTTWTIWRYDWQFEEGPHTFEVRCYEGDGTLQVETQRGTRPSGATGIHSEREVLPDRSTLQA